MGFMGVGFSALIILQGFVRVTIMALVSKSGKRCEGRKSMSYKEFNEFC
jgi:hypothetical protein